ncbi:penicillin-binding protein 1A [Granulicella mallensis]|uniref:Penicillin-binding protein 1A n=1 Tax=Granulicella mallensis TaxID=940614 RepID=A0A7W8EA87_9BACT|nr:PBP1A family penicillin-binding protein [Granulicella mallensis]MBB5064339.1 penicillin-binding protein 1A [Granulicella mallensis]
MPSPLNSEGKKLSKPSASDARRSDDRSALWRAMRTFPFREPEYRSRRVAGKAAFLLLLGASAIFGIMVGLLLVYSINLPQMADLERYRPSTTTELYDIHGKVFGSFALERRVVVPYSDFPPVLRDAILSIEDKDFESNSGINMIRMVGAAWHDMHSARRSQGASTLTMQLARNLFLSSEKTYGRKVQEIFLTLQIERHFTKSQIFTLYANQIYLGRGTYGFEAGSEYYFSKHVRDLTLSEAALLAALPKGPESYSPVRFPDRALKRRNLVLSEMFSDHKITAAQAEAAKAEPLGLHLEAPANIEAPYFVEEVRRQLEAEYGVDEVHGAGLRVYTTLDLDLQHVAEKSVLDGTAAYERRHGWKGRLQNVLGPDGDLDSYKHADWTQPFIDGAYFHALVVSVSATKMVVKIGQQLETMATPDWAWTATFKATDLVQVGDIVYVKVIAPAGGTPRVVLEQDSGAQASMMAMDNANGEVLAMVGGRDFAISQFNRATQAQRQVGSSFKPYVYTAAFEAGAKPYDTIVDGPTSFYTPNGPYTPHNYEANFRGTMTLIDAFAESRNIPALKLADRVGIKKVIEVAHRFGITSNMPNFLPVAIGAADISLAEQVAAYSVFPNDGIRIAPHYIRKVSQADGLPLEQKTPEVKEVISLETARQMMLLLQSVVQQGTAAAASQMKHPFGGKTGTTNSYTDAWFIGFSPSVTCGTWIGFDNRQSLGDKETGAKAALPMWMDFMKVAVAGRPNEQFSKFNAPKKQLEVPMAQPSVEQAKPAHRDEDTDDDTDKTQSAPSPVPSNDTPDDDAPAKPAAGPTAKGPAKASSKTHVAVRPR